MHLPAAVAAAAAATGVLLPPFMSIAPDTASPQQQQNSGRGHEYAVHNIGDNPGNSASNPVGKQQIGRETVGGEKSKGNGNDASSAIMDPTQNQGSMPGSSESGSPTMDVLQGSHSSNPSQPHSRTVHGNPMHWNAPDRKFPPNTSTAGAFATYGVMPEERQAGFMPPVLFKQSPIMSPEECIKQLETPRYFFERNFTKLCNTFIPSQLTMEMLKRTNSATGFPFWLEFQLHTEIAKYQHLCQSHSFVNRLTELDTILSVGGKIFDVIPDSMLHIFGSFVTGLSVPQSDLDIMLTVPGHSVHGASQLLAELFPEANIPSTGMHATTYASSKDFNKDDVDFGAGSKDSDKPPKPVVTNSASFSHFTPPNPVAMRLFPGIAHKIAEVTGVRSVTTVPTALVPVITIKFAPKFLDTVPELTPAMPDFEQEEEQDVPLKSIAESAGMSPAIGSPSSHSSGSSSSRDSRFSKTPINVKPSRVLVDYPCKVRPVPESMQEKGWFKRERDLSIDITLQSFHHRGFIAAHYTRAHIACTPLIAPLVLILKSILSSAGLAVTTDGGISSIGIFLMVQTFLHQRFYEENIWRERLEMPLHISHYRTPETMAQRMLKCMLDCAETHVSRPLPLHNALFQLPMIDKTVYQKWKHSQLAFYSSLVHIESKSQYNSGLTSPRESSNHSSPLHLPVPPPLPSPATLLKFSPQAFGLVRQHRTPYSYIDRIVDPNQGTNSLFPYVFIPPVLSGNLFSLLNVPSPLPLNSLPPYLPPQLIAVPGHEDLEFLQSVFKKINTARFSAENLSNSTNFTRFLQHSHNYKQGLALPFGARAVKSIQDSIRRRPDRQSRLFAKKSLYASFNQSTFSSPTESNRLESTPEDTATPDVPVLDVQENNNNDNKAASTAPESDTHGPSDKPSLMSVVESTPGTFTPPVFTATNQSVPALPVSPAVVTSLETSSEGSSFASNSSPAAPAFPLNQAQQQGVSSPSSSGPSTVLRNAMNPLPQATNSTKTVLDEEVYIDDDNYSLNSSRSLENRSVDTRYEDTPPLVTDGSVPLNQQCPLTAVPHVCTCQKRRYLVASSEGPLQPKFVVGVDEKNYLPAPSLGSYFLQFLFYFGNLFNPRTMVINPYLGAIHTKDDPMGAQILEAIDAAASAPVADPLYIFDPFFPGKNVGRSVYRFHQIQALFRDIWERLVHVQAANPPSDEDLERVVQGFNAEHMAEQAQAFRDMFQKDPRYPIRTSVATQIDSIPLRHYVLEKDGKLPTEVSDPLASCLGTPFLVPSADGADSGELGTDTKSAQVSRSDSKMPASVTEGEDMGELDAEKKTTADESASEPKDPKEFPFLSQLFPCFP